MKEVHCVVWADGLIEIMDEEPKGGISIAEADRATMESAIAATARLAYDGENWIVPEVRSAWLSGEDKVKALIAYQNRLAKAIERIQKEAIHGGGTPE